MLSVLDDCKIGHSITIKNLKMGSRWDIGAIPEEGEMREEKSGA